MFRNLINACKNKEIRIKLIITIALLFVYRMGCYLPVPGIDAEVFAGTLSNNTLLNLLSQITGSALANGAFLAIGISPYINSSIIVQLLTIALPPLERLSKQGDEGKRKINNITRIITLLLALAQAIGIAVSMNNADALTIAIFGENTQAWVVISFVTLSLVAGAMFTTWLGERITDVGAGNGISLLIFVGIIATAGQSLVNQIIKIPNDNTAIWELLLFLAMVLAIFLLIVLVDLAERRVPIQYAKQVKGRKQYGGQSTHIPIKLNASGVMPIIFATAIITFPQLIFQMFAPQSGAYAWYEQYMGATTWPYSVMVGLLILFFSYFYAQIQFKPEEVARNIQQYGGFIPGIRAGKPTSLFLGRISKRLTLFGAIYLAILATVPALIFGQLFSGSSNLVNAFTATGLMIVVSVALEFNKQLESLLMMKHYKGFLK